MPGHRLVEADLSSELSTSRGAIREALRILSQEGLVDIALHRGAMVRKMSRRDVAEIFEIREALEGLAARLAAQNIDEGDRRARLLKVMEGMEAAASAGDVPDYMNENHNFHRVIVEISGNQNLANSMARLRTPLFRLQFLDGWKSKVMERSNKEHQIIAKAILDGDAKKAARSMQAHVRQSGRAAQNLPDNVFGH